MIRATLTLFVAVLSFSVTLPALAEIEQCFKIDLSRGKILNKKEAKLYQEGYVSELVMRTEKQTFVGVGFVLGYDNDGRVIVVKVVPGSPAEQALSWGMAAGTKVIAVNGVGVLNEHSAPDVAQMIRGNGTIGVGVVLTLQPKGGRIYERYVKRKRLTAMIERPYICFEKKGR